MLLNVLNWQQYLRPRSTGPVQITCLSVVSGTYHNKAVLAWKDLIWYNGGMRCTMATSFLVGY